MSLDMPPPRADVVISRIVDDVGARARAAVKAATDAMQTLDRMLDDALAAPVAKPPPLTVDRRTSIALDLRDIEEAVRAAEPETGKMKRPKVGP